MMAAKWNETLSQIQVCLDVRAICPHKIQRDRRLTFAPNLLILPALLSTWYHDEHQW